MFTNQIFTKIFVKISSIFDAIPKLSLLKARYSSAFLLGFSFLIFCSCTTTKTIPPETLRHDTLYINKQSYDSIYIDNTHLIDRGGDTITITNTMTEYRFRLLRDTIRIAKVDSIPYEVRITEVEEVPRPRNFFDYVSCLCFGLVIGAIGWRCTGTIR